MLRCDFQRENRMHCINFQKFPRIIMFQHIQNYLTPTPSDEYLRLSGHTILNHFRSVSGIYQCLWNYTLVHIFSNIIHHTQHWYDSIRITICSTNLTTSRTNIVNMHSNPTSSLGNQSTLLHGIENPFQTIRFHGQQITRT